MKFTTWIFVAITLMAALVIPVAAEVVYTPVYVSIPTGGHYDMDVNGDGIIDFTLNERLLIEECKLWWLDVFSHQGNAVVGYRSNGWAAALPIGRSVDSSQVFIPSYALMATLGWGVGCHGGRGGFWLNQGDRYLGLQFQIAGSIHYGWARVSTSAYVDQNGRLHTSTILSGFAYETIPGKGILAGQISGD